MTYHASSLTSARRRAHFYCRTSVGRAMSLEADFSSDGYFIASGLLSYADCRAILRHEKLNRKTNDPSKWIKDRAAIDPFFYRMATNEKLIALLLPIVGPDIICWGVDIVKKRPGQIHPWHSDIESCAPEGGFASIWIGLAHTSRKSSLHLVSRSHRFGHTVQEELHRRKMGRREVTDDDVLAWAKETDPAAKLIVPNLRNGDALVFDGRLWHGSRSSQRWFPRTAVLLQFANAERPVRMFDRTKLEWPLRYREDVLPPVFAVSGKPSTTRNLVVQAPKAM
jgi:hypothetical protein